VESSEFVALGIAVLVACIIGALCRNRGWNSALVLLFSGIVLGLPDFTLGPELDPELILLLVLAPLVFGEALSSSILDIRRVGARVSALAILLVLIGAALVGVAASLILPGLALPAALCLGAVLGPTDAVSVASTAKSAGLPRRVLHVLEGESLLNDGTALSLLRIFISVTAAGAVVASELLVTTALAFGGGIVVGVIGGVVLHQIAMRSRDSTVTNGLLLLAPLPIYGIAELVQGSGILAVVIAALIFGQRTSSATGYRGRLQATSIWRAFTFILQSSAFFLVGMGVPIEFRKVPADQLSVVPLFVAVVLVLLIVSRFAFVYVMGAVGGRLKAHPREWVVLGWAGTRGPISVLAALTIPKVLDDGSYFPDRALIIFSTSAVVVVSLLLSTTLPAVVRWARLTPDDEEAELRRAKLAISRAALDCLDDVADQAARLDQPIDSQVLANLRSAAEVRLAMTNPSDTEATAGELVVEQRQQVGLAMIRAEQEELLRLRDNDALPDSLFRQLQLEIDARRRTLLGS